MKLPSEFVVKYSERTNANALHAARKLYDIIGKRYTEDTVFDVKEFQRDSNKIKLIRNVLDNLGTRAVSTMQMTVGYLRMFFRSAGLTVPSEIEQLNSMLKIKQEAVQDRKSKEEEWEPIEWDEAYDYWNMRVSTRQQTRQPTWINWTSFILVAIMREVPLRPIEITQLRWKPTTDTDGTSVYVDMDKQQIVVVSNKVSRRTGGQTHPFSDSLKADLKRYQNKFYHPYVVFKNVQPYGQPMNTKSLRRKVKSLFNAFQKATGRPLRTIKPKEARSDVATRIARGTKGGSMNLESIEEASEALGHSNLRNTLRYYIQN